MHYNGSSLLQWRSVRLDVTLDSGKIAGALCEVFDSQMKSATV